MSVLQMQVAHLDKVREQRIRELETELGCQVVALQPETRLVELSKEQARRVEAVERELAVTLVAYEPFHRLQLAKPPPEKLKRIRALEKDLEYVLIAYEVARQEASAYQVPEDAARPVKLSDAQYRRLQTVEAEVGLTLMAYQAEDDTV